MAYTDHRIPAANLVGEPGGAWPRSSACSGSGASTSLARAVGVARAALDAALPTQQRTTFGKPIGEHQAIQLKLADMATRSRRRGC